MTTSHTRTANAESSMGCTAATCSCGWVSAPTNRPQHLNRTFRSHATAAKVAR